MPNATMGNTFMIKFFLSAFNIKIVVVTYRSGNIYHTTHNYSKIETKL